MKTMPRRTRRSVPATGCPPPIAALTIVNSLTNGPNGGEPVIAKKPTIVFIYIGINDVWHGQNDPAKGTPKDKFEAGLKEVIGKITATGAKVIVCTPTVIGEKKDGGNKLDAKLDEYAEISRGVAKELKLPLCDLRAAFVAHLKANNADNKDKGVLTGDTVHLNATGNKLVAETMLKSLASGK